MRCPVTRVAGPASTTGSVLDLGFGVLTLPSGEAAQLLGRLLPADDHYDFVSTDDDPDLETT